MNVLITIDEETCVGIGRCEQLEPDAVELGPDAVSRPLGVALPLERAQALCSACPSGAISIVDEALPGTPQA